MPEGGTAAPTGIEGWASLRFGERLGEENIIDPTGTRAPNPRSSSL
jgi:hypothetical protein